MLILLFSEITLIIHFYFYRLPRVGVCLLYQVSLTNPAIIKRKSPTLFRSDAKFNSGCGWPAFSKSVDNDLNIVRLRDTSMGLERVEVRCKQVYIDFRVNLSA